MQIIGIIFWLFVAWKVGGAIGRSIGRTGNSISEKAYHRKEQEIARRYDSSGQPTATVWRHRVGDAKYEQYMSEVNQLRGEWGKKPLG